MYKKRSARLFSKVAHSFLFCVVCSFKSFCVSALAAQFFAGAAAGKAVVDVFCSLGGKNTVEVVFKEVAEGEISVGVEAAGNDGTI